MLAAMQKRLSSFWENLDPMVPMVIIAALVGFMGALAVEVFHQAMYGLMRLYTTSQHLEEAARGLPMWMRVAVPAVFASVGGLIMWGGHRWIKRPRGPEYMEAVRVGDGILPLGPNATRTISSLVSVSGGITIGREGTMIQLAALMSSLLGRLGKTDAAHRRLIVACGAAAGFAGAYHAPIAGTMFVSEIILGGLALREITAILVSAVIGELTTQALFASGPLYISHHIPAVGFSDLLDATLLGVLAGFIGPAFMWAMDNSRRWYQSLATFVPLRMGLAGLVIGLLSVVRPEVWGNGFSAVQSFLVSHWALSTLGILFVVRLLATIAASAAGIPGGVLTPTLTLGGILGLIVGHTLLVAHANHSQDLWVLVGMGSLLAATTHAPAMSAIMMFETTRNYNVVLATMPACVVASVIGSLLRERSVYTEALGLGEHDRKPSLIDAITGRKKKPVLDSDSEAEEQKPSDEKREAYADADAGLERGPEMGALPSDRQAR